MELLLCVSTSKKKRVYFQHLFSVYCDVLQLMQKLLLLVENRTSLVFLNSFQVWLYLIHFASGTELNSLSPAGIYMRIHDREHLSRLAKVR